MTDVTCAACGSAQSSGSAFCAVCGQPFPRTGRPVASAVAGPQGGVQAAAGGPGLPPFASGGGAPDTTTEPEVYTATQKAVLGAPSSGGPTLLTAPYAGVGRRFLAYLVDGAAIGVIVLAVLLVGTAVVGVPLLGGTRTVSAEEASALLGRLLGVYVVAAVIAIAWWVGLWFWEGTTGKTLGNLATGIRTLDAATRAPVGFGRAFLRWLVVGAGSIVVFVGQLVVVLSPAFDSSGRRQGWQDKVARSVVVDARGVAPARDGFEGVASLVPPAAGTRAGAGYPAQDAYGPTGGYAPGGYAPAATPSGYAPAPAPGYPTGASPTGYAPPAPPRPTGAPTSAAPSGQPAPTQAGRAGQPPAPLPDPWAFPSSASSPASSGGGLITGVPGSAGPAVPAQAAPHPQQHVPAQAVAQTPEPVHARAAAPVAEPEDPEWDSTRMGARDVRAMEPAPVVTVVLELESGERRVVDGPALVGRNPQPADGEDWILVAVEDPTRSVSKTHVELGVDPDGLWVSDRGSTNGTVVSAPGTAPRVAAPGARVRVPVGATIHVGDRRLVVHPGPA
ncbi:RDD family protein [Cellulosimicrobium sp. Marseille-Q4280]|uniref:RDD family protein n=1 Tax=Cellulosimicrobium sp. Marseille-Q4280 TaxID=2937992 RepID=UPI002557D341|nr:RDD family protein [Cellulosimicrobium sp. Marseille-Q4280]